MKISIKKYPPSGNLLRPRRLPRWNNKDVQSGKLVHWLDIWLPRISHFSQFGLFVVTLGSLYYIVLPIYQKTILDEVIAKREIELREMSAALEESYRRVRSGAVKEFALRAGAICSGLVLPVPNAILRRLGKEVDPNRKPLAQEILEINPQKCLVEQMTKYPGFRNLRADDMKQLHEAIVTMALELDEKRLAFTAQSRVSWASRQADENAMNYGDFVRTRTLTLNTFSWKE